MLIKTKNIDEFIDLVNLAESMKFKPVIFGVEEKLSPMFDFGNAQPNDYKLKCTYAFQSPFFTAYFNKEFALTAKGLDLDFINVDSIKIEQNNITITKWNFSIAHLKFYV